MNSDGDDKLAQALLAAARAAGLDATTITALKRLSGGANKENWAFILSLADGTTRRLVLRREPQAKRFATQGLSTVAGEAAVIRVAAKAGVPVPEVLFELPPDSPIGDGYVMQRMVGETLGGRVLKLPELATTRSTLAHRCGEVLARLHAADTSGLSLPTVTPAQALASLAARHAANGDCRPVFDFALGWLHDHLPKDTPLALVHGDFRNGNLVVGAKSLVAVIDWELAHIGAPASDLGWLCVTSWRFQRPDLPVGGFGTRAQLLEGYVAGGGQPIALADLHAWEVYQTMNWGVMCAGVGKEFEAGNRSVEGAVIARRASETEFDLMRLLAPESEVWSG